MNTNQAKHLDPCIEHLKRMLGDKSNELESGTRRALAAALRKLKKLKKQPTTTYEDVHRTVAEVAKTVLDACVRSQQSEDHS